MPASATLRDRLPSAAAAIALQGGLLALLALSFEVVRHVAPEQESIIVLPPLVRPQPQRAPVVIDARPRASTITPPAAQTVTPRFVPPTDLTLPAAPGNALAPEPGHGPPDCAPRSPDARMAAQHAACPPPPKTQAIERPLSPQSHAKDEAYWAEEKARGDGPLPGTSFDTHSTHITLFKSDGPSILGGYRTPDAAPTHAHSSDVDFQKALAATQARTRALYAKPAPPPPEAAR